VRDVSGRIGEANSFSIQHFNMRWCGLNASTTTTFDSHIPFVGSVELKMLSLETGSREKIFGLDFFAQKLKVTRDFSEVDASADFRACWLCFDPQVIPRVLGWLKTLQSGENSEEGAPSTPRTPFFTPAAPSRRPVKQSFVLKMLEKTQRLNASMDFRDVRGVLRPSTSNFAETFGCSQIDVKVLVFFHFLSFQCCQIYP
jgi:hypothetical protein